MKNVSCEYNRLNGWNSTLQAAWYIRHVRIFWRFYFGHLLLGVRVDLHAARAAAQQLLLYIQPFQTQRPRGTPAHQPSRPLVGDRFKVRVPSRGGGRRYPRPKKSYLLERAPFYAGSSGEVRLRLNFWGSSPARADLPRLLLLLLLCGVAIVVCCVLCVGAGMVLVYNTTVVLIVVTAVMLDTRYWVSCCCCCSLLDLLLLLLFVGVLLCLQQCYQSCWCHDMAIYRMQDQSIPLAI